MKPWGPFPISKVEELLSAPAGKAAEMIRQYDPLFGVEVGDGSLFKATVSRVRITRCVERATVEVRADSEEKAKSLIDLMEWDDFDWKDSTDEDEDYEDYEIDRITEVKV